jgi:hypothetical protein
MTFRTGRATATISLICLIAGACGGSTPAAPTPTPSTSTANDSLRGVTNLAPATGTVLQPGQTVAFGGTAGYSLATADSGTVFMVIQDQANHILQEAGSQPRAAVVKGSGDVALSQTITLPTSGVTSIVVFFALLPAGATTTSATASVTYSVR